MIPEAATSASSKISDAMHYDQAWPEWRDFDCGGGLHELRVRGLNALLLGLLGLLVASQAGLIEFEPQPVYTYGSGFKAHPQSASLGWLKQQWGGWSQVFLPGLLLGWFFFPLRCQLGPARLSLRAVASPPRLTGSGNLATLCREGRERWPLLLALVLAAMSGWSHNFAFLLLMLPLIAFSQLSCLWTEIDLASGRVFYHRTFCGLQITRPGGSLDEAEGVLGGVVLGRPGEEQRHSVCALLPGHLLVPLNTQCASRQASDDLAQQMALRLDLPCLTESALARGCDVQSRVNWRLLASQSSATRPPLPPGGEE